MELIMIVFTGLCIVTIGFCLGYSLKNNQFLSGGAGIDYDNEF